MLGIEGRKQFMKPHYLATGAIALAFQLVAVMPCWAEDFTRQEASGACMLFIKQLLHDPGTAEFGHSQEATVILKGNRATVIRRVRAVNAYGAKRLGEFKCVMEKRGRDIIPVSVIQVR